MNVEWHVGRPGFVFIYGPQGEEIAQVSPFQFSTVEARSIAAQIVREHNAHDELVAALNGLLNWAAIRSDWLVAGQAEPADHPIAKARVALAKAGAA